MKKYFLLLFILMVNIKGFTQKTFPNKPVPIRFVNDFAKLLTKDEKVKLETKLRQYSKKTTIEMAVVTISNLGGLSVEEYANQLARKWGIGKKSKNNGLLILLSKKEQKIRIEVGYGLESRITDSQAKAIIDENMKEHLKKSAFYEGLDLGSDAIIKLLGSDAKNAGWQIPGFRLVYYIPFFIILLFTELGFMKWRKLRGKALNIRLLLLFTTLFWTALVEGYYFFVLEHKALIGIVELIGGIFIFYSFYRRVEGADIYSSRRYRIKLYLENSIWDKFRATYKTELVNSKIEYYEKEYKNKRSEEDVNKILKEIEDIMKNPDKYFSLKEDIKLNELIKTIRDTLLSEVMFSERQRRELDEKMIQMLAKIKKKPSGKLDKNEIKDIKKDIKFLQKIIDKPKSHFKYDYKGIEAEIKKVFKDYFWKNYRFNYREDSIKKTRKYFEKQYKAIKNENSNNKNQLNSKLLDFYLEEFKPFVKRPKSKLKVKTSSKKSSTYKSSYTPSYGTSSNDYDDSYLYDSSDNSSSNNSFGGGDFGGGGASGEW